MAKDKGKEKKVQDTHRSENDRVLSSEDLDKVSGGASLRKVGKVKTTDIGDNTKSKI